MSIYAVGDIQGCLQPLKCLLDQCQFDSDRDVLWCAGDLVNRGPESLETLRFIRALGDSAVVVLGNHDLHLLAVAYGHAAPRKKDTLNGILDATDRHELLTWLRHQKLVHTSEDGNTLLAHAGIPPIWSSTQALNHAREIEAVLQSDDCELFLRHMYGDEPDTWDETLSGPVRWRLITNYFTRMRFCKANGQLDLRCKLGPDQPPLNYLAWYQYPHRLSSKQKVLFGHWAALEGRTGNPQFVALDTGCVWGGKLSLYRFDDGIWFYCNC